MEVHSAKHDLTVLAQFLLSAPALFGLRGASVVAAPAAAMSRRFQDDQEEICAKVKSIDYRREANQSRQSTCDLKATR